LISNVIIKAFCRNRYFFLFHLKTNGGTAMKYYGSDFEELMHVSVFPDLI